MLQTPLAVTAARRIEAADTIDRSATVLAIAAARQRSGLGRDAATRRSVRPRGGVAAWHYDQGS
jgi:hypothetical protein